MLRLDPRWARRTAQLATGPPAINLKVTSFDTSADAHQSCCCIAGGILLLPLPFAWMRRRLFESRRWRNSNVV